MAPFSRFYVILLIITAIFFPVVASQDHNVKYWHNGREVQKAPPECQTLFIVAHGYLCCGDLESSKWRPTILKPVDLKEKTVLTFDFQDAVHWNIFNAKNIKSELENAMFSTNLGGMQDTLRMAHITHNAIQENKNIKQLVLAGHSRGGGVVVNLWRMLKEAIATKGTHREALKQIGIEVKDCTNMLSKIENGGLILKCPLLEPYKAIKQAGLTVEKLEKISDNYHSYDLQGLESAQKLIELYNTDSDSNENTPRPSILFAYTAPDNVLGTSHEEATTFTEILKKICGADKVITVQLTRLFMKGHIGSWPLNCKKRKEFFKNLSLNT